MTNFEVLPPNSIESHSAIRPNSSGWLKTYSLPLIFFLAMSVIGMIFSFLFSPIFLHSSSWITPPDLWGTFRTSQYIVWGAEGQIYNTPAHLQTFPGISVILSPIAWLSDALHLSESFPLNLSQPSAWLLLGPAQYICGGLVLFPLDALMRRLSVSVGRRSLLLFFESALVWPSLALWGHPEDALALALALFGLMAAFDQSWFRIGLYFGLAIVIQPLTLLVLPIALAYVPIARWPVLAGEIALPSFSLLLPPLIQEWGPTTYILLKQPNFPLRNHPTPWMSLSPIVKPGHFAVLNFAKSVALPNGKHVLTEVARRANIAPVVGSGPGRIVSVIAACIIGFIVAKRRPPAAQVLWLTALALSLRCIFEPVMVPYYLLPGLAVVMIVSSQANQVRMIVTIMFAIACAFLSFHYQSPWAYYLTMSGTVGLALFFAKPSKLIHSSSEVMNAINGF